MSPKLDPVKYRVWLRSNKTTGVTVEAATYVEAKRLGAERLRTKLENLDAEVVREDEAT